ncbi:MAG TPA: ribosome biogenesis GTP-binding protein YihA/YsxC [Gammaproteobacteria bacterium]
MNSIYAHSRFLCSAHKLSQLPPDEGIEVAFAGRSNAGKSSALNTIAQSKALAKVSRTPGRTQLINFFQVDDHRFLVDLPGYGYAKVPEATRRHWQHTLSQYLLTRKSLLGLFLIMDIRHALQPLDWRMIEWCRNAGTRLHVLLTKSDKLSRSMALKALRETHRQLEQAQVEASLQIFSALKHTGVEDAHSVLDEWFGFNRRPVSTR